MSDRRTLLVTLFVFLSAIALMLVFRSAVDELIVIPIQFFFWLLGLLIKSLGQAIFWALLLLVVAFLMLRSLISVWILTRRVKYKHTGNRMRERGRVSFWSMQVRLRRGSLYPDDYTNYEFKRLVQAVLAFRMNLSPQEVQRRLEAGELELPPGVQAYFAPRQKPMDRPRPAGLADILTRLRSLFGVSPVVPVQSNDRQLEQLIQFMEKQLEAKK